jgi:phosphatidylserine synthase
MISRLLLYVVLLPGLAIPWAAMIWFPDLYATAYRIVVDHPYWVLAVAILLFLGIGYYVLLDAPSEIRRKLIAVLALIACVFLAYILSNFASLTIVEATVYSAIAIYVISAITKKQNEKSQDT